MSRSGTTTDSLLAGTAAALGASACCAGPLLSVMLGIGGAWGSRLVTLEPYQPLFVAAALGFFGFAFHRLYRSTAVCTPGDACAVPAVRARQRAIFLGRCGPVGDAHGVPPVRTPVLLRSPVGKLSIVLLAASMVVSVAHGADQRTATLDVTNMDCAACPIAVRKALEKVPGVGMAKVDYKTKRAVVVFEPAKTTPDALTKATADAGFLSTVKEVQ